MKTFNLKIKLLSPSLVGSGEGYGATIDSDIIFDEIGLPYVPAKRIKGCLLDSANEINEMFGRAGVDFTLPVTEVFGEAGTGNTAPVCFSNLFIEEYRENKAWLEYYLTIEKYRSILSKNSILETFAEIRQQTRISDDGVAFDGSLRTSRLMRKGLPFIGDVSVEDNDGKIREVLVFACMNFRNFGTSRNRGFGEIKCSLMDGSHEISVQERLEDLCIS